MRTQIKFAISLCLGLIHVAPAPLSAQGATLDQAEALLRNGQTVEARAALDELKKAKRTDQASAARLAYLSARLASNVAEAEDAYLGIALNHPTSAYAAESLLRLGQARLAAADARQAAVYLQRLLADYPRSEHRGLAAVWLARAHSANGRSPEACTVVQRALSSASLDSETTDLLRTEQSGACAPSSANLAAERSPAPAQANAQARPTPSRGTAPNAAPRAETRAAPASAVAGAATGSYTIQVAAFRERAGARTTVRELERAGFAGARVVTVPDNTLIRVRLGRFANSAAASSQLGKLKAAGFTAIIVNDAHRERTVRD